MISYGFSNESSNEFSCASSPAPKTINPALLIKIRTAPAHEGAWLSVNEWNELMNYLRCPSLCADTSTQLLVHMPPSQLPLFRMRLESIVANDVTHKLRG